jgi:hypothetical protein
VISTFSWLQTFALDYECSRTSSHAGRNIPNTVEIVENLYFSTSVWQHYSWLTWVQCSLLELWDNSKVSIEACIYVAFTAWLRLYRRKAAHLTGHRSLFGRIPRPDMFSSNIRIAFDTVWYPPHVRLDFGLIFKSRRSYLLESRQWMQDGNPDRCRLVRNLM